MSWLSKLFNRQGEESIGLIETIMLTQAPLPMPGVKPPKEAKMHEPTEAERIADSLRQWPDDWSWGATGKHYLQHAPSGFRLWVSNQQRGLGEWDGHRVVDCFSDRDKAVIWPAVSGRVSARSTTFTGRPVRPRIICGGTYWYCRAKGQPWVGVGTSPESAYRSWSRAISVEQRKEQRPEEVLHVWSTSA